VITSSEVGAGERLEVLLTLTLRGRRYRFGTSTITIANANDTTIPARLLFVGAVSPIEYEDSITIGGELAPDRSVTASLIFGDDDGDAWADIVAADHDLGDALGEIALWRTGDDWGDRRVVLSGRVVSPSYGSPGEPVTLTIAEEPGDDRGLVPDGLGVVSSETWASELPATDGVIATEAAAGQLYPRVYGAPGIIYGTDTITELPAVPALVVGIDTVSLNAYGTNLDSDSDAVVEPATVLLMGHPGSVLEAAATVTLYNMDAKKPKSSGWAVASSQDLRGREVVTVSVNHDTSPAAGMLIDADHAIYWSAESAALGGVYDDVRSGCMRNAAEIIEDLLSFSTLRYDVERIRSIRAELAAFRLDFFVNEQRSPYDIISEDILPILPVSPVIGPRGLYFSVWNFLAETSDAVDTINPDRRGGYRNSPVEVSDVASVFNRLTIDYGLRADTGEYARALTVAPDNSDSDPDTYVHPAAFASATRYTTPGARLTAREGSPIASDVVYAPQTARAVLEWMLRAHCSVFQTVEYVLPQRYAGLDPGDIVVVTDDAIRWADRVCLVQSITRGIGDVLVVVRTLPYWVRDAV